MNILAHAWYRLIAAYGWREAASLRADRKLAVERQLDHEQGYKRETLYIAQCDYAIRQNEKNATRALMKAAL